MKLSYFMSFADFKQNIYFFGILKQECKILKNYNDQYYLRTLHLSIF